MRTKHPPKYHRLKKNKDVCDCPIMSQKQPQEKENICPLGMNEDSNEELTNATQSSMNTATEAPNEVALSEVNQSQSSPMVDNTSQLDLSATAKKEKSPIEKEEKKKNNMFTAAAGVAGGLAGLAAPAIAVGVVAGI